MINTLVSNWNEKSFDTLFQQQRLAVILDDQSTLQTDFYFLIDKTFQMKKAMAIGFVQSKITFIPYLSLSDNLFIGLSVRSKEKNEYLNDYLRYVGLSKEVLYTDESELTLFEHIKLQLIQLLVTNKDIFIIDNIFQELSVKQRQELLPLLQQIAQDKKKAILILTNDSQIAKSSYIDTIIKSA